MDSSPRPVLLTKAASEREARPASLERERPITVMRKDETVVLPSIDTSADGERVCQEVVTLGREENITVICQSFIQSVIQSVSQ